LRSRGAATHVAAHNARVAVRLILGWLSNVDPKRRREALRRVESRRREACDTRGHFRHAKNQHAGLKVTASRFRDPLARYSRSPLNDKSSISWLRIEEVRSQIFPSVSKRNMTLLRVIPAKPLSSITKDDKDGLAIERIAELGEFSFAF